MQIELNRNIEIDMDLDRHRDTSTKINVFEMDTTEFANGLAMRMKI